MISLIANIFTGFVNSLPTTLMEGFVWGILAMGVYISYRILDVPDMTVDGSLALGGIVSAMLTVKGWNVFLTIPIAVIAGALAGIVTALLHTKLKIPAILSGILTMFALYSINMRILGNRSSQSLVGLPSIKDTLAQLLNIPFIYTNLIFSFLIMAGLVALLYWFFGTQLGSSIRATGCNPDMARAQGINTDNMKIAGLALSNGIAALSGCLFTQLQGSADVNMASGTIVIGLASVVIGEIIFNNKLSFWIKLSGAVAGATIYRTIIVIALLLGMPTSDLKLVTAVLVALALSLPLIKKHTSPRKKGGQENA